MRYAWLVLSVLCCLSPAAADGEARPKVISPAPSAYERVPPDTLSRWVAKVNGDPISVALFTRRLAANRSSAYLRFSGGEKGAIGEDFWTKKHDGETPAEWLKRRTLEDCVRIKVELGIGKKYGLIPDTSYATFLKALDRENERRRAALARGEPIYGPEQYGEREFLLYTLNNLRLAVQSKLAEEGPQPSEKELREFYETVKGMYFRLGDKVKIQGIRLTQKGTEPPAQAAARARLAEARERLEAGDDIQAVAAEYDDEGKVREWTFGPGTNHIRTRWRTELRDTALSMKQGELREVSVPGDAWYLIRCEQRESLGYRPFEEVRNTVRALYMERKYRKMVDGLVRSARVEINRAEWDKIEPR